MRAYTEYHIETITKEYMVAHAREFSDTEKAIFPQVNDKNIWKPENYLIDLPAKWDLSMVALDDKTEDILGYAILSASPDTGIVHLHKLIVISNHQSQGIGSTLCDAYEKKARESDYKIITLCVLDSTPDSIEFYQKTGYRAMDLSELKDHLALINKDRITGLEAGNAYYEANGDRFYMYHKKL